MPEEGLEPPTRGL
jgi:hypothetical protein